MNIYALCPDGPEPIGGVKMLYKYVDALNKTGFSSYLVHFERGFRCHWFNNDTRVTYLPDIDPDPEDFWLVPEIVGPGLYEVMKGGRKVVFNQNCYYAFRSPGVLAEGAFPPYFREDVVGAQVVSEDSRRYLEYAFPGIPVGRVHYPLDEHLFAFSSEKGPRIALMTRKNAWDAVQVLGILKARGALEGLETIAIDGIREDEVASILRGAFLFLSFGYPEGFGLPAAEAMLCGCSVVGFHGMGGSEFFKPEFSRPVAEGEIIEFARAAEEEIQAFRRSPDSLSGRARRAADYIRSNFNQERWESDISSFWRELLEDDGESRAGAAKALLLSRWQRSPSFPPELLAHIEG